MRGWRILGNISKKHGVIIEIQRQRTALVDRRASTPLIMCIMTPLK